MDNWIIIGIIRKIDNAKARLPDKCYCEVVGIHFAGFHVRVISRKIELSICNNLECKSSVIEEIKSFFLVIIFQRARER